MSDESKGVIFQTILGNFLEKFEGTCTLMTDSLVEATIGVFNAITRELLPTPAKTHYTFNLRDLSKVIQGVLMGDPKKIEDQEQLARLWAHEVRRVFADRFINNADHAWFVQLMTEQCKEQFGLEWTDVSPNERLIYGDFMIPGADPRVYDEIPDMANLQKTVEDYLLDHNAESKTPMNLVMFLDAIEHVCRIARILRQPQGNALCLGVGGSGRQSMSRLASYISQYEIFQIEVTKGYGKAEWREDVKSYLMHAGIKDKPTTFLFSDVQIVNEGFVEDINNILNAGDVPNIYVAEDMDAIVGACRSECQKRRIPPTKMNIFAQYVARVRKVRRLRVFLAVPPRLVRPLTPSLPPNNNRTSTSSSACRRSGRPSETGCAISRLS